MELHAFELIPDLTLEELNGATVAYGPNTHLFNIKEELEAGNGVIVSDDTILTATLMASPILQSVSVPPEAVAVVPPGREDTPPPQPVLYEPQEPGNLVPETAATLSIAAASPADEGGLSSVEEPARALASAPDPEPVLQEEVAEEVPEEPKEDIDEEKDW